jgi:hypothetical protein
MNAKTNIESRLVSRDVPVGTAGRLRAGGSLGSYCAAKSGTFKRTPRALDLKRRGRFLAKDSSQGPSLQFPMNDPVELAPSARRYYDRRWTRRLRDEGVPSRLAAPLTARRRVAVAL